MRFQKISNKLRGVVKAKTMPEKLVLLAPVMVWFSYYPTLQLGRQSGTNLELSIAMVYMVVLALVGLPSAWRARQQLLSNHAVWLFGGYVAWHILSIGWAINPLRATLVAGVWGILLLDFLAVCCMPHLRELLPVLLKVMVGTAVVMSLVAIVQVAYGAWFDWGLCAGCVASGFGFVRPSVFAIEPQFFGSLLLAPILFLSSRVLLKKSNQYEWFYLVILFVALYLTLSRGAIYACLLAIGVQFVLTIKKRSQGVWASGGVLASLMLCAGFMGMGWHGLFTQLNPRLSDTFYDSVAKSVNHMSLGRVTVPSRQARPVALPAAPQQPVSSPKSISGQHPTQKAAFDGYVERSTRERTGLSQLASQTWTSTPRHFLFGVGAGGAGRAIFQQTGGTTSEFEIIQHEFLSVAVELGLVGLVLFAVIIWIMYRQTARCSVVCWGILTAFVVQWNFFSGLPNALHIYLVGMLMFAIINRVDEKTERIN